MSEHPISNLMTETMAKIKEMVDVNTIIGTPITTADGTTVIPVSKVTFGFASGGSDFAPKHMPAGRTAGLWRRRRCGRDGIARLLPDYRHGRQRQYSRRERAGLDNGRPPGRNDPGCD